MCHAKEETTTAAIERESYRVIAISRKYPLSLSLSLSLHHTVVRCVFVPRWLVVRRRGLLGSAGRNRERDAHTHTRTEPHKNTHTRGIGGYANRELRIAMRHHRGRAHTDSRVNRYACVCVFTRTRASQVTHTGAERDRERGKTRHNATLRWLVRTFSRLLAVRLLPSRGERERNPTPTTMSLGSVITARSW